MDFAVDLETLGRNAGCVVLSVGMVAFDPRADKLGEDIYMELQLQPQLERGLHIEEATLRWWAEQEHRDVLSKLNVDREHPLNMCCALSAFVSEHGNDESRVWAVGTDFDISILRWLYCCFKQDWPFWYGGARDVRTLCDVLNFDRNEFHVEGRPHHALDDAKYAALLVQAAYRGA